MAVETHTVIRCDICSAEDAKHCAVVIADQRWNIDLCESHRKPLDKLAAIGSPAAQRPMSVVAVNALDARVRGLD